METKTEKLSRLSRLSTLEGERGGEGDDGFDRGWLYMKRNDQIIIYRLRITESALLFLSQLYCLYMEKEKTGMNSVCNVGLEMEMSV